MGPRLSDRKIVAYSRFMGATSQREHFGLVHALRGVASMWVVLFHASEGRHIDAVKSAIPEWSTSVFDLGDNGVAIFFALSGFVIAHSLRDHRITASFLGRFALRRSIRLDPPLWASMVFVVALAALSAVVKAEAYIPPTFGQVVTNATYTQLFFGYASINSVYWTLCYEVQFYLALCLFIMAYQRGGAVALVVMYAVAILYGTRLLESPLPGLFVDLWHCFLLGALAYWAHRHRTAQLALAVLVVSLIVAGADTFTAVCILTALGLYVSRRYGYISNGLGWRPLMFLGTISYSLYLTHNPVTGASFYVMALVGMPQWAALVMTIAACVVFAFLFWWAIERPSMKLAHRVKLIRAPQTPPASGFAAAE